MHNFEAVIQSIKDNTIYKVDIFSSKKNEIPKIEVLADALKNNMSITELSISNIYNQNEKLKTLFITLKSNKSLTKLTFSQINIGNEGSTALAELLEVNESLEELDILGNGIGDEGIILISHALKNKPLIKLDFSCNKIGPKGANAIAKALETNELLKDLNISHNNIEDKGIVSIADKLKNKGETFEKLSIANTKTGDVGLKAIAEALQTHKLIKELDISRNSIGNKGAKTLVEILKSKESLRNVNFSHNMIGDEGSEALIGILKYNFKLTHFDVTYRLPEMSDRNLVELCKKRTEKFIERNKKIQELENWFNNEGFEKLSSYICYARPSSMQETLIITPEETVAVRRLLAKKIIELESLYTVDGHVYKNILDTDKRINDFKLHFANKMDESDQEFRLASLSQEILSNITKYISFTEILDLTEEFKETNTQSEINNAINALKNKYYHFQPTMKKHHLKPTIIFYSSGKMQAISCKAIDGDQNYDLLILDSCNDGKAMFRFNDKSSINAGFLVVKNSTTGKSTFYKNIKIWTSFYIEGDNLYWQYNNQELAYDIKGSFTWAPDFINMIYYLDALNQCRAYEKNFKPVITYPEYRDFSNSVTGLIGGGQSFNGDTSQCLIRVEGVQQTIIDILNENLSSGYRYSFPSKVITIDQRKPYDPKGYPNPITAMDVYKALDGNMYVQSLTFKNGSLITEAGEYLKALLTNKEFVLKILKIDHTITFNLDNSGLAELLNGIENNCTIETLTLPTAFRTMFYKKIFESTSLKNMSLCNFIFEGSPKIGILQYNSYYPNLKDDTTKLISVNLLINRISKEAVQGESKLPTISQEYSKIGKEIFKKSIEAKILIIKNTQSEKIASKIEKHLKYEYDKLFGDIIDSSNSQTQQHDYIMTEFDINGGHDIDIANTDILGDGSASHYA